MRFYQDRLGFDLTYYNQKTTDDIVDASVSLGSGFSTTSINVGELTNKGIELLISGTPVRELYLGYLTQPGQKQKQGGRS